MKKLFLLIVPFFTECVGVPAVTKMQADSILRSDSIMSANKDSVHNSIVRKYTRKQRDSVRRDSIAQLDEKWIPPSDFPTVSQASSMMKVVVSLYVTDPDDLSFIEGNAKMFYRRDSSFLFNGYVKVMNDYGALAPMAYNVGLKWRGGDWSDNKNWAVNFCNITNPE